MLLLILPVDHGNDEADGHLTIDSKVKGPVLPRCQVDRFICEEFPITRETTEAPFGIERNEVVVEPLKKGNDLRTVTRGLVANADCHMPSIALHRCEGFGKLWLET